MARTRTKHEGKSRHRFGDNPMEKMYADAWARANKEQRYLDYMLADNNLYPTEVEQRDATVAATVMQWLGSPVGREFVKDVQQQWQEFLKRERVKRDKNR